MGGSIATGKTNDELIDNLVDANLIKTPRIEKLFRSIDRGMFFLSESKSQAYKVNFNNMKNLRCIR